MTWLEAILRGARKLDELGRQGDDCGCHGPHRVREVDPAPGSTIPLAIAVVAFVAFVVAPLMWEYIIGPAVKG